MPRRRRKVILDADTYVRDLFERKRFWFVSNPYLLGSEVKVSEEVKEILASNIDTVFQHVSDRIVDFKAITCSIDPMVGVEEDVLELLLFRFYKNNQLVKLIKHKLINVGLLVRTVKHVEKCYCCTCDFAEEIENKLRELNHQDIVFVTRALNTICVLKKEDVNILMPSMYAVSKCNLT